VYIAVSRTLAAMAPRLPPDIILLICEELANQRAFGTLFNAALSSKQIAASALLWLYRYFKFKKPFSKASPSQIIANYHSHIAYGLGQYLHFLGYIILRR
jgi:hypothetical protein